MPKYVIEREFPARTALSPEELQGVAQTSCGVLNQLGSSIQWVHSDGTGDKVYCVYIVPNDDIIQACPTGWLSRQSHLRDKIDHRSDYR